ncbi:hypothetical protein ACGF07_19875 [Kitasatospora sp. NPDC048194]|uniref:hypothetical protein n=1 Tax=Kitasatospora sp. NPDC048194 TaxID=3364045 RepID=UPI00371157D4
MPRPSAARFCLGSFTVAAVTVALLAVSGASGVLGVAVPVVVALVLGTVVTVFPRSGSARSAVVAERSGAAPAGAGRPYARQR